MHFVVFNVDQSISKQFQTCVCHLHDIHDACILQKTSSTKCLGLESLQTAV